MDPASGEAIHREIARRVVPELVRDGLIPSGPVSLRSDKPEAWRARHLLASRSEGPAARSSLTL